MMASNNNQALYTGVTSNLHNRVLEHKQKVYPGSFTAKYHCVKLVYFEPYSSIEEAIAEEKRIKGGNRKAKDCLVNLRNPEWKDLWEEIQDW